MRRVAVSAPTAITGGGADVGTAQGLQRIDHRGHDLAPMVDGQLLQVVAVHSVGDGVVAVERLADAVDARDRQPRRVEAVRLLVLAKVLHMATEADHQLFIAAAETKAARPRPRAHGLHVLACETEDIGKKGVRLRSVNIVDSNRHRCPPPTIGTTKARRHEGVHRLVS